MKKKKVVICAVQVPFVLGGAELHVESLQRELVKRGFEAAVVQVPFKWYPKTEIMKHALLWRMMDLSESNGMKIDLVIATKFPSYAVKHENKVTWLFHQYRGIYELYGTKFSDFDYSPEDTELRNMIITLDNKVLPESRLIFTNAQNTANRLLKYNGIEGTPLYHPPKHVGRYYCREYSDYVLSVGRLDKIKRVDLLVEAMRHTKSRARCLIAGTGPQKEELEKYVAKHGLEKKVRFLGFVTDEELLELYANSFAVYFAPYDEDYGYITLEAYLSRKPVLTTWDAGGVLEFVEHSVNGFVLENDPEELAAKIDYLYAHKTLCADYGMQGYEKVEPINWNDVIDKLTSTIR